jgi:anti-anti-sigma factor
MQISHTIQNEIFLLKLTGNFDMYSSKEVEEYVIRNVEKGKFVALAIHLRDTKSIDSSGIGCLLRIANALGNRGMEFVLSEVPSELLSIIVNSGVNQIYKIFSEKQFQEKYSSEISIQKQKFLSAFKSKFLGLFSNNKKIYKLGIAIGFLLSILGVEYTTKYWETKKVHELSVFMKSYVWELDEENAKDFAKILVETKNYEYVHILHPDGSTFVKYPESKAQIQLSPLTKFLQMCFLIRTEVIESKILRESNSIGKQKLIGNIQIGWINSNIYIHFLLLLIYLLVGFVISSYLKIIQSRKELTAKNLEINEKMEEVQRLKVQQDGDYFLISLLTKPLGKLNIKSNRFSIEKLIKQKKKFEFKNRIDEIGGDICVADRIILRGKKYIIFSNADAMGKSLQGAGGILVFGSVLNSIIQRNKASVRSQLYFPEQWLRNNFIDLDKVFQTFGGSMLISMVFGLIDEETGLMYWMNAEHPGVVLYRDGKASFLDNEKIFFKLGTEGIEQELVVKVFQFLPGDSIFVGSDGRDDIILGKDEKGFNIINSDEFQFLQRIQECRGELPRIYESLKSMGELSDDLSLMKIQFLANPEEFQKDPRLQSYLVQSKKFMGSEDWSSAKRVLNKALEQYPNSWEVMKLLIKVYLREKDYKQISNYIEKYLDLRPTDTEYIYLASYSFKKLGNFELGSVYGERYRIHKPKELKNLFNLYECYYQLENYEHSLAILDKILEIDPENPRALAIKGGEYVDEDE